MTKGRNLVLFIVILGTLLPHFLFLNAFTFVFQVHAFGFGADSNGNWSHYWEHLIRGRFRSGVHPGLLEYAMIKELSQHQIIKFYKGW